MFDSKESNNVMAKATNQYYIVSIAMYSICVCINISMRTNLIVEVEEKETLSITEKECPNG